MTASKIMISRNCDVRLTSYIFSQLEYVILIWNDTTNVQIYSFWTGASSRQSWHFGVKILTKNDEKMIDLESIQIHSSIVQGPPGYQKMTRRAYFLHRKCSIRVIRGQGGPSSRTPKFGHFE